MDLGELTFACIDPIAFTAAGAAGVAFHGGDVSAIQTGDEADMTDPAQVGVVQ